MASQVTLKALGLNYSPNNLSLPEGSLIVADDVIVRRDNVIESRRGFREYSEEFGAGNDRSNQLIVYKDRILNHYNNILQYDTGVLDNDGKAIFDNFNGTYNETQTGLRIKSIESNKNLYFTTDKGIKKIVARTASDFTTNSGFIEDAGAIKALDFSAELDITQGQTAGFLPVDSAVAYRILWGYRDINDNLILGAPSSSVSVYNYLSNIVSLDLNTFLIALDNCVQNDATYYSVLHNSTTYGTETFGTSDTFSSKFKVDITDDPTVYAANVNSTAEYIDKFATLGDVTATYVFSGPVLGVNGLTANDIYRDLLTGNDYTVLANATGGAALTSVSFKGTGDPAAGISGTTVLTKQSGAALSQATISYSSYTKTLPNNKPLQINTEKTYTFTVTALGSSVTAGTIYQAPNGAIFVANAAANGATTFTAIGSNNPTVLTGLSTSLNLTRISVSGGPATITYTTFTVTQAGFSSTSGIGSIQFTSNPSTVFSAGDLIEITDAVDGSNNDYSFTLNKRYTFTLNALDATSMPTFSTFTSNGQTFTVLPLSSPVPHTFTFSGGTPAANDVYGYTDPTTGYTYRYTFTSTTTADGVGFPKGVTSVAFISLSKISGAAGSPASVTCTSIRLTSTSTTLICAGTGSPTTPGAATTGTLTLTTPINFTITSNTLASPTVVTTSAPHGLYTNETVIISGSNSNAAINGTYQVIVTGASTFTLLSGGVPVNVTVAPGTAGNGVNKQSFAFTGYVQSDPVISTGSVYTNNSQRFTTTSFSNLTTLSATGTGDPNAITSTTILSRYSGNGDTVLQYSAFTRGTSSYTSFNNTSTGTDANKFWTITSVDSTNNKILFNIASTANITSGSAGASVKLLSYNYRNIIQTGDALYATPLSDLVVSTPATSEQLRIIQNTIGRLATRLKNEKTGYISSSLKTAYVSNYSTTSYANVNLNITVPQNISNLDYFLQVYRTRNFTATGLNILGVDVTPDDEMRLVFEAFPITTLSPLPLSYSFIDEYPEALRDNNANLYTNPVTGEGILQANDIPPVAKDINRFKNVVFYANTKTRHRLNPFQLIGTSNISTGDTISISNGISTNIYEFIEGVQQQTNITFQVGVTPANFIAAGSIGKHFTINSAEDEREYYVWYRLDNIGNDPGVTGPSVGALAGKIGIRVDLLSADTDVIITDKTLNAINAFSLDFITTSPGTRQILVTNSNFGVTTAAGYGTLAPAGTFITLATTVPGQGEDAISSPPKVLLSKVSASVTAGQAIDETARSLVRIINKTSSSTVNAYYISSSTSLPGIINFESKLIDNIPFYIQASTVAAGASFSPNIEPYELESAANGAQINYISANLVEFRTDTSPGSGRPHNLENGDQVFISLATVAGPTQYFNGVFTVTVTDAYRFQINVTTSGFTSGSNSFNWSKLTNVSVSNNEDKSNRIYYSKLSQPDAVPLVNYFDIGASDKQILRIFPLRDSLFVFKEDGLYRISGEVAPFVVGLFDSSCVLIAPDSVSVANNVIYGWTTKGISNITEAGVTEVSRPIDTIILKLASSNYANFSTATWGLGYDSDNSYTVYTCADPEDELATIGFRFSNLTNTWTNFKRSQTCGVIRLSDDRIYTGSGSNNVIDQERKSFDRTDYADKDFNLSLPNGFLNDDNVTLNSTLNIEEGDVLTQTQGLTVYKFNSLLNKLDLDAFVGRYGYTVASLGTTSITVTTNQYSTSTPINHDLSTGDWINIESSNTTPSIDGEYQINNSFSISSISVANPTTITTALEHGLTTGDTVIISGTNTTATTNGSFVVTVTGVNTFTIPVNVTSVTVTGNESLLSPKSFVIQVPEGLVTGTSGIGNVLTRNYFKTLQAFTGDNLRNKIVQLASYLDTDPNLTPPVAITSYSNIIASKGGSITEVQTGNPGSIITPSAHEILENRVVTISGTLGPVSPNIVNTYKIDLTGIYPSNFSLNSFQIPVDIITGDGPVPPTGLNYSTSSNLLDIRDITACFNGIINTLNLSTSGTSLKSYSTITENTTFEAIITSINTATDTVKLNLPIQLTVGEVTIYKAIPCNVIYSPITFGDPLQLKQVYEATLMFSNKAFYKVEAGFSSDLKPEFTYVNFEGQGNGNFGNYSQPGFGYGFFGGASNAAPCRTLVPRQNQRCRFINMQFSHNTAREIWSLYGVTLTFKPIQSTRAYR